MRGPGFINKLRQLKLPWSPYSSNDSAETSSSAAPAAAAPASASSSIASSNTFETASEMPLAPSSVVEGVATLPLAQPHSSTDGSYPNLDRHQHQPMTFTTEALTTSHTNHPTHLYTLSTTALPSATSMHPASRVFSATSLTTATATATVATPSPFLLASSSPLPPPASLHPRALNLTLASQNQQEYHHQQEHQQEQEQMQLPPLTGDSSFQTVTGGRATNGTGSATSPRSPTFSAKLAKRRVSARPYDAVIPPQSPSSPTLHAIEHLQQHHPHQQLHQNNSSFSNESMSPSSAGYTNRPRSHTTTTTAASASTATISSSGSMNADQQRRNRLLGMLSVSNAKSGTSDNSNVSSLEASSGSPISSISNSTTPQPNIVVAPSLSYSSHSTSLETCTTHTPSNSVTATTTAPATVATTAVSDSVRGRDSLRVSMSGNAPELETETTTSTATATSAVAPSHLNMPYLPQSLRTRAVSVSNHRPGSAGTNGLGLVFEDTPSSPLNSQPVGVELNGRPSTNDYAAHFAGSGTPPHSYRTVNARHLQQHHQSDISSAMAVDESIDVFTPAPDSHTATPVDSAAVTCGAAEYYAGYWPGVSSTLMDIDNDYDYDDESGAANLHQQQRHIPRIIDFINELPIELAYHTLGFLNSAVDLINASQVSRKWHLVATDNLTWKSVFMNHPTWHSHVIPLDRVWTSASLEPHRLPRHAQHEQKNDSATLQSQSQQQQEQQQEPAAQQDLDEGQPMDIVVDVAADGDDLGRLRRETRDAMDIDEPTVSQAPPSEPPTPVPTAHTGRPQPKEPLTPNPIFKEFSRQRGIDWRARYIDRVALTKRWQHARHVSMRYLLGHTDSVYCLQFDRRKLVTGSRDRTIKIWDMNTWKCTQTLYGHDASVLCLKYDAQQMVTGSSDSSVIVWDAVDQPGTAGSFKPAYQLKSHSAGVLDVSFNDDYIVSCSKDLSIKVWSRERDECGNFHTLPPRSSLHQPRGRQQQQDTHLFERQELPPDATAAIMDLPSLPLLRTLTGHRGPVNALQLRSNRIVSASGDATIRMWDPDSGQCLHEYTGHGRGLACVQFDGRRIVSGSNDQTIKVWDAETGKCLQTLTGHTDLVRTLHYPGELEYPGGSVSGGKLVSGSYDQTVKVWDIDSGKCLLDLRIGHSSWVFDVQLSHSKIISSSQDSKVLVHDFGDRLDVAYL